MADEQAAAVDMVNHPPHYNSSPAKCASCGARIECIDVVEHLPFNIGSAIKYLWRAGLKGPGGEDRRKAIWYIEREIARLKRGLP